MNVKTSHVVIGLVLAGGVVGLMVGTRGTRVTAEARHGTPVSYTHLTLPTKRIV